MTESQGNLVGIIKVQFSSSEGTIEVDVFQDTSAEHWQNYVGKEL